MARPTTRQILEELLRTRKPAVEQAFLEAIAEITNRVQVEEIIEALSRGNIEAALDGIGIQGQSFEIVVEAMEEAYIKGGRETADALPLLKSVVGKNIVFRFSARNPQAEAWLSKNSSDFITSIVERQRNDIRSALRAGMERGDNPKRVALDIAGRVQKGTNRRSGGLIGLSGPQMQWVDNAKGELKRLSARDIANYMRRKGRDKRYDRTVMRAYRTGNPLSQAQIDVISGRYSDRLLKLRADAIGRTEAMSALGASQHESYRQAIASGALDADAVKKKWKHSLKPKPHRRETHHLLHNTEKKFLEPFVTADGTRLLYARDTSLGAGAKDNTHCACATEYWIDFTIGVT